MAFSFYVDELFNDFRINNGDLVLSQGAETVRQQIRIALNTELGEWFLNRYYGIKYYPSDLRLNSDENDIEAIFGNNITAAEIEAYFLSTVYNVPGVQYVLRFEIIPDSSNRRLEINMTVVVSREVFNGIGTQRNVDVSLTVGT